MLDFPIKSELYMLNTYSSLYSVASAKWVSNVQVSLKKVTTIKSEARRYELFMKKKRVRGDKIKRQQS